MTRKEIVKELKSLIPNMEFVPGQYGGDARMSIYLGSYLSLDPCGRYHHILSLNGATKKCEAYWARLDKAADEVGGWIESGEGDPTDIYFSMPIPDTICFICGQDFANHNDDGSCVKD